MNNRRGEKNGWLNKMAAYLIKIGYFVVDTLFFCPMVPQTQTAEKLT